MKRRSSWIPGAYAPELSEKRNSCLRRLKNQGFTEESLAKVGWDAISTATTLESNKSLKTFGVVDEGLYVYHDASIAY